MATESSTSMGGAKPIACDCEHKGQDEIYGKGKRLGNATQKGTKDSVVYRCTVCGKEGR